LVRVGAKGREMVRRVVMGTVLVAALAASGCSRERAICGRMKDLCSVEAEQCKQSIADAKESFGDEGVTTLAKCFEEAKSCAEASGCVAGGALKNLSEAADGFLKGLGKGLEKK
jgi:hypothetical protein